MNGGADQFLEFGVQRLTVRDIIFADEKYTIEVYELPTPEDAFGIYSVHTFKCACADTLGKINCFSPYQLQAVIENNYVSVVFPSGSDSAGKKAYEIIDILFPDSNSKTLHIPDILNQNTPFSGQLKFIKGPLSLSKASFSLSDLIKDIPYHGIWFISEKKTGTYKALILADNNNIEIIRGLRASENILEYGDSFIYFSGTQTKKKTADTDSFGF